MTLRQLRGFLGITRYCSIWILGYGEPAWPLYKLITENQQAQTDKLFWSPDTQKAFKALQSALLQASTLNLSTGVLQEEGPLPGAETGLLSNIWK